MRKNAQQMDRKCLCGKPAMTFQKNGKIYWKNICSACYSKAYRKKNPEITKRIIKRSKAKYKQNQGELKAQAMLHIGQTKCKHCDNHDIRVLSFHHRDPKEKAFRIAWALTHSYALETIKTEAEKCDILCSNCHLIVHATKPSGRNWGIKRELLSHVGQFYCSNCASGDIRFLSFHHLDAAEKEFTISKRLLNTSIETLKKEAEKCQILCENCHRIEHSTLALAAASSPSLSAHESAITVERNHPEDACIASEP
jgi:hypothetical protein